MISPEVIVLLLILIAIGAYMAVKAMERKADGAEENSNRWAEALANEESQVGRVLLGAARPVSSLNALQRAAASPLYASLERQLLAAGAYGRSVEVFLSVQILALFVSSLVVAGLVLTDTRGLLLYAVGTVAVCIAAVPYNQVYQAAQRQSLAVSRGLPEFAELLQMPLNSGVGIRASLRFTAERLEGPVPDAVHALLSNLSSRTMTDVEAFDLAGQVLGTPEAAAFFTALKQADQEGAKVTDTIAKQAEALRSLTFQRARANLKKLPTKILLIFFIHLMPLLLAIALIPTFYGLLGVSQ